MRVFLTGATGFIGSRVLPELLAAGHDVVGNSRSDEGARRLEAAGAKVHRGDLNDPINLARGAEGADAVIHTAFDHDFAHFQQNCEKDRDVIRAIGAVLASSNRPFLITSAAGLGSRGPGEPASEDVFDSHHPIPRVMTEVTGNELTQSGISVAFVRLPQVHDTVKQGLVSPLINLAREKRLSAYVGEGANRWTAAHVDDVARLYRLALEHHKPGVRWHAVAEEAIPVRLIAEAIGKGLGVPVQSLSQAQAGEHFGWLAGFVAGDQPASAAWTREQLGWKPSGPGLLDDLRAMDYQAAQ